MSDIKERALKVIAQQLNQDAEKISLDNRFVEDLGADSLDLAELVIALEDEFGTKIADDKQESLHTVGDAISYIEESVAAGKAE